jgi:serine protease Do
VQSPPPRAVSKAASVGATPATPSLPPWIYAAAGAAVVLFLALSVALVVALNSRSSAPPPRTRLQEPLASRVEPAPTPADQPSPGAPSEPAKAAAAPSAPAPAVAAAPPSEAPTPVPVTPSPTSAPLTTAQIVKRCEPSVALIKGKVSSGTGFMIGYGVIATNAHVIEDEFISNLDVRFPSAPAGHQGPISAQLLFEDRKRDIAFLAVKSDLPVLRVAPNYSFVKGEDILVIGNPGLGGEVVLENAISRGVMSSKTVLDGMNYHQMNISINPGNSGGPVFDSQGRVIGVATLKSNKTEAMGFCIPVEDVNAALGKLAKKPPDPTSHHRASVAFKALSTGGALYSIVLEVRAAILQKSPAGGSDANLLPSDEVKKLHQAVTMLDEKLVSLVEVQLPSLATDPGLGATSQRGFQDLSANYQSLKKLYNNPNRLVQQYFAQIQNLKSQHLQLVESMSKDLRIDVPPQLLAALQPRTLQSQAPPNMVAEFVPFQMQPGFMGPGMVPGMGPGGPRVAIPDPLQAAREHRRKMQEEMKRRMRGMRGGPPN